MHLDRSSVDTVCSFRYTVLCNLSVLYCTRHSLLFKDCYIIMYTCFPTHRVEELPTP